MLKLPESQAAYWSDSAPLPGYEPLRANIEADVAIIGGGIAGMTAAYVLKQAGKKVVVLEKNEVASGTTGGTTGKVTSQHGLIYHTLYKRFGSKTARAYASANQSAIGVMRELIERENIGCDWQEDDSYVYTTHPETVRKLHMEATLAQKLGLPASYEHHAELPFMVEGVVKFENQAKMNARKYVLGLASKVHGEGSAVYEHSEAEHVYDGNPARVKTAQAEVLAKDVIIATKVPMGPLFARVAYAALEYPHTSYIVAGEPAKPIKGMYISPDKGHYSLLPVAAKGQNLLLIGGENHIPGHANPEKRWQKLADYGDQYFGFKEITYRWKAMDYIAYDRLPLVGRLYPWSKHLFVVSGFKKWGLTTSMVSALLLRGYVLGHKNPWTELFDSMRIRPVLSIPRAIFTQN